MDIFKLASQIANNISDEDKQSIENMDMEKMISHVTQNIFKIMGTDENGPSAGGSNPMGNIFSDIMKMTTKATEEQPNFISPIKKNNINEFKTRDICFDLNVDLEDFYNGKKKKLNVKRKRVIDNNGVQQIIEEKKKLVVVIEKGMKDEQQIIFEGEADQIPGYTPGDIIITLIENEHPVFQRDNDNLMIVKNINLYQLYDLSFEITHLDNKVIKITKPENDALHLNESLRKIKNMGMPVFKSLEKGDLFIRFNLVIPKSLNEDKLSKFKDIFKDDPLTLENVVTNDSSVYLLENVSETDLEDIYTSDESYSESESDSESETESETESDISVSSVSSDSSVEEKKGRRKK